MQDEARRILNEIYELWKQLPPLTQSRARSAKYLEIEAKIRAKSEEFEKFTENSVEKKE